jgi:hypothetical protein
MPPGGEDAQHVVSKLLKRNPQQLKTLQLLAHRAHQKQNARMTSALTIAFQLSNAEVTPQLISSKSLSDAKATETFVKSASPRMTAAIPRLDADIQHQELKVPKPRMTSALRLIGADIRWIIRALLLQDASIDSLKRTSAFPPDAEVRSMTTIASLL